MLSTLQHRTDNGQELQGCNDIIRLWWSVQGHLSPWYIAGCKSQILDGTGTPEIRSWGTFMSLNQSRNSFLTQYRDGALTQRCAFVIPSKRTVQSEFSSFSWLGLQIRKLSSLIQDHIITSAFCFWSSGEKRELVVVQKKSLVLAQGK